MFNEAVAVQQIQQNLISYFSQEFITNLSEQFIPDLSIEICVIGKMQDGSQKEIQLVFKDGKVELEENISKQKSY